MPEFVNIAGYKFVTLDRLPDRRQQLLNECRKLEIMGTILVSEEGINLFLAGTRLAIDGFLEFLKADETFQDFSVKESLSDDQPFNRLLVRIKNEIISFGVEGIDPQTRTSPKLKPSELKQWLDDGKPVTLLDVRNNYEVELGTFDNAVVADIDHFRQFPEAVNRLATLKKQNPIVMFCTGGIRCEKAGPFMEQAGFESVFQLDGGILQYFQDCGGEHYDGDCFVFDQRVAVDPELKETDAEVCFACQAVLKPELLGSPKYVAGVSCPVCYKTDEEQQLMLRDQRHMQIRKVTEPLPGSIPYDNFRPMNVPRRFEGYKLIDFVSEYHPHVGREVWESKIAARQLLYNETVLNSDDLVRGGQRLEHLMPATVEPAVSNDIRLIYEDDFLVAINKPAPLPMHPSGRFNRNSLQWILGQVYDHQLRITHRLDANTTGLVVFSKTRKVAALLQPQFEKQQVSKTYLALVHGVADAQEFTVDAAIAVEPVLAGGRRIDPGGKECRTDFRVLSVSEDGNTSLIQAMPRTGRTNQIRIHLWQHGLPIVGDPTYLPGREMAAKQTLAVSDPPMCLHAWKLELKHPESNESFRLESPRPSWCDGSSIGPTG